MALVVRRTADQVVFRNRVQVWLGSTLLVVFSIVYLSITAATIVRYGYRLSFFIVPPAIYASAAYMCWLLSRHMALRLGPDGIVVDNMLVRHVIPWGQARYFAVEQGMFVQLLDGRRVPVRAWTWSITGGFTGYSWMQPVRERIQAECSRITGGHPPADPSPPYRLRLRLPDWPVIPAALAVAEVVCAVALLARR